MVLSMDQCCTKCLKRKPYLEPSCGLYLELWYSTLKKQGVAAHTNPEARTQGTATPVIHYPPPGNVDPWRPEICPPWSCYFVMFGLSWIDNLAVVEVAFEEHAIH